MYLISLAIVTILALFLAGYGVRAFFVRGTCTRAILAYAVGSNVFLASVGLFYETFATI